MRALFERAIAAYQKHYGEHVSRIRARSPASSKASTRSRRWACRSRASPTRPQPFTHPLLKDTGLFDYFELILSGDTLPKRKPDPLPLLHACEVFEVTPAELLLIGDSLNDTQAGARRRLPGVLRALRLQPRPPGRRARSAMLWCRRWSTRRRWWLKRRC